MNKFGIVHDAMEQFWQVIADNHPEIKTGDFPPEALVHFEQACLRAYRTWLASNS